MQRHPRTQTTPQGSPRRRGMFLRFFRGYLMLVGAGTTIYVLVLLIVDLLVNVLTWLPAGPAL